MWHTRRSFKTRYTYHLSSGFSSRTRLPEPSIDAISSQAPKTVHSISSVLEGLCLHSARASNILDSISHAPLPHLSCQYINKNLLTRGKWITSAHYLHTQQWLPIRHVYNNIRQSGIGLTENWRNNSYSPIFFTSLRHMWIQFPSSRGSRMSRYPKYNSSRLTIGSNRYDFGLYNMYICRIIGHRY